MLKILNMSKIKKISKVKLNIKDLKKIKRKKIDAELTMKLLGLINFSKFPQNNEILNYFSFLNSDHL